MCLCVSVHVDTYISITSKTFTTCVSAVVIRPIGFTKIALDVTYSKKL